MSNGNDFSTTIEHGKYTLLCTISTCSSVLLRGTGTDGSRFGQTEPDFCLRFGLNVNLIFGSETEETLLRNRVDNQFFATNFFFVYTCKI